MNHLEVTMVLGPMYHLYNRQDKLQALSEALRVTKPGGYVLTAYCMNEPTVVQYVFGLPPYPGHPAETRGKRKAVDNRSFSGSVSFGPEGLNLREKTGKKL